MKHIVFVKNIATEEDVQKISEALSETRAIYDINLSTSSVTIEGSNDVLHHAKQVIMGLGYIIE